MTGHRTYGEWRGLDETTQYDRILTKHAISERNRRYNEAAKR